MHKLLKVLKQKTKEKKREMRLYSNTVISSVAIFKSITQLLAFEIKVQLIMPLILCVDWQ